MSAGNEPTEAELRAAYEEEIKKIRVEHVLLETIVSLVNLGMRRTGLAPGTESERDSGQVRLAIEAIRGLLPLVEQTAPQQAAPIREALAQLQLAFVRIGGQPPPPGAQPAGAPAPAAAEGAGAAPGAGAPAGPSSGVPPAPGSGSGEPQAPGPGGPAAPGEPTAPGEPPKPGEPGPAQSSGRLWIPGR